MWIKVNIYLWISMSSFLFQEVKEATRIIERVFLIFPQFCLGNGLVKLSANQLQADVYDRFDIDKYVDPFTFEMLGWNLVAMGIQGFVFMIINLIIEARPCQSSRFHLLLGSVALELYYNVLFKCTTTHQCMSIHAVIQLCATHQWYLGYNYVDVWVLCPLY